MREVGAAEKDIVDAHMNALDGLDPDAIKGLIENKKELIALHQAIYEMYGMIPGHFLGDISTCDYTKIVKAATKALEEMDVELNKSALAKVKGVIV